MSKPNVKMAIIILMTIVAIILSLYFYTKETASEEPVPVEGIDVAAVINAHVKTGRHVLPQDPGRHLHYESAPVGHTHPGDMAIWKAQIDAAPIGAYDVRPTESNGNLSSAVFDDMKDSFKESNLMLIGNNSTDIHFLNGGLLMKGFEDHVKKPLRDDVNTNRDNITEITKDSSDGLLYAAKARIAQNETDITDITKNSSGGLLYAATARIAQNETDIITNSTQAQDAREQALADLRDVIKAEIDYYDNKGGSTWVERIGANTAYDKAGTLLGIATWED